MLAPVTVAKSAARAAGQLIVMTVVELQGLLLVMAVLLQGGRKEVRCPVAAGCRCLGPWGIVSVSSGARVAA